MASRPSSAAKDAAHVTPEWEVAREDLIEGVRTYEVKNIITRNGVTTEILREDWGVVAGPVRHAIHVSLHGGAISAWHMHELQTDHIFAIAGALKAVLYDSREDSPTHGVVNEFRLHPMRPTLLAIPPGVWHGLENVSPETSCFINYFDHAYNYENPDEWRLPADTQDIPYRF
jgi:dTDP-4-dehydrorhamnose 3,5-epimerase